MVKKLSFIVLVLLFFSCKKAEDKTCFKSYGDPAAIEIPLDSVSEFRLYKNITYHVYQDTMRKLIVKGGENMIKHVLVENDSSILSITNENNCNFLRDFDKKTIVEIHYPFYSKIYSEANDSLIFMNTIVADLLYIEQAQGGAGVRIDVDVNHIVMLASLGVANFVISGSTNYADLRVQTNASGDARNLVANHYLVYNNSTGDIYVDLDSADAGVTIKGTGNVIYSGTPDSLNLVKTGDGDLIKE